jgi:hypothetical protein
MRLVLSKSICLREFGSGSIPKADLEALRRTSAAVARAR